MLDWITGKKVRLSMSLSPTCLETLDAIADHTQLSRTEVIEQIAAGRVALVSSAAKAHFKITPEGVCLDTAPAETAPQPVSPGAPPPSAAPPSPAAPQPATSADTPIAEPSDTKNLPAEQSAQPTPTTDASPDLAPISTLPSESATNATAVLTGQLHQQVANLSQQLASLQAALQRQQQAQVVQQQEYRELTDQANQQQRRIEELEQQLVQAQQLAAIGEAQVNRWRFQNYSR